MLHYIRDCLKIREIVHGNWFRFLDVLNVSQKHQVLKFIKF